MLKKIVGMTIGFALCSTLYAREDISQSTPFIGLEIGYANMQADATNFFDWQLPQNIHPDFESSDIEFGVKIGARKDDWRTTLLVNYLDTDNDGYNQNYLKGSVEIDYLFSFSESGDSPLKPFLGLNVGYIDYETGDIPDKIESDGFTYGGQVGIIYTISNKVDIDLKYRYTAGANVENDINDRNSVQSIGSFVLGISYLY